MEFKSKGGKGNVYQNIDGLVNGAFGNNVLDTSLIHVHRSAVFKDGACCMEILRTVHLVVTVKEEVSCLISHSFRRGISRIKRTLKQFFAFFLHTAIIFVCVRGGVYTENISQFLPLDDLYVPGAFRDLSYKRVTCMTAKRKSSATWHALCLFNSNDRSVSF